MNLVKTLMIATFMIGFFSFIGGIAILFDLKGYDMREISDFIGIGLLLLGVFVCVMTARALKHEVK